MRACVRMRACVYVCVRACVRVRACACVRACERARVTQVTPVTPFLVSICLHGPVVACSMPYVYIITNAIDDIAALIAIIKFIIKLFTIIKLLS